jgi:hypothetical protein
MVVILQRLFGIGRRRSSLRRGLKLRFIVAGSSNAPRASISVGGTFALAIEDVVSTLTNLVANPTRGFRRIEGESHCALIWVGGHDPVGAQAEAQRMWVLVVGASGASGVIGVDAEVSKQEGLATGPVAAAVGLDGDENSVDLCQHFGIVGSQDPALPRSTVFIENTEVEGLLPVRSSPSPGLERASFCLGLLVEIVGVKDQRLPFGEEHPAVWLFRLPVTSDIVHFRDIEIAATHQFADVAIMREKLLLLIECTLAVVQQTSQVRDFGFERGGLLLILGRLVFERIQRVLQSLSFGLGSFQPLA